MENQNYNLREKLESLENATKAVHGYTTFKERSFLFRTASSLNKNGVIVEIGSWKGKSTIWLAAGSKMGNKNEVYAVDPFTGSSEHHGPGKNIWNFDEFKQNINNAGVNDIVRPLVAFSKDAVKEWNKPVEFLFIDGAHEYEFVREDFLLWSPYVVEGGIIAFHDTTPDLSAVLKNWPIFGLPGPKKVVRQYILNSTNFKNVRLIGSIVYATKCASGRSSADALQSKICGLKMDFNYFLYGIYRAFTHLPQPVKSFLKKITGI